MTREEWLKEAAGLLAPLYAGQGKPIPAKLRVSCGFPNRGANGTVIGQCWYAEASADAHVEVFVSPLLDDATEVIGTLAHELCHAALGRGIGHKAPFKRLGEAIGLVGKPKHMTGGPEFNATVVPPIVERLGPYPHARLTPNEGGKKQTTRMIKCECPDCGYIARTTRQWLEIGPPHCPEHGPMEVKGGAE